MKSKIAAAMAAAAVLLAAMPCFAAFREQPVSVVLSVTVQGESGEYCRIIVEDTEGREEDRLLSVKEGKTAELTFEMEEPGSRRYRIYQTEGTETDVVYDKSVYTAEVSAWIREEKLCGTVVVQKDRETEKPDAVVFRNTRQAQPEPPVKTGDGGILQLWGGIGFTAAAGAAVLFLLMRKRRGKG